MDTTPTNWGVCSAWQQQICRSLISRVLRVVDGGGAKASIWQCLPQCSSCRQFRTLFIHLVCNGLYFLYSAFRDSVPSGRQNIIMKLRSQRTNPTTDGVLQPPVHYAINIYYVNKHLSKDFFIASLMRKNESVTSLRSWRRRTLLLVTLLPLTVLKRLPAKFQTDPLSTNAANAKLTVKQIAIPELQMCAQHQGLFGLQFTTRGLKN